MTATGWFCHYQLRTTDAPAAGAFYAQLLGWDARLSGPSPGLYRGQTQMVEIAPVPERLRALGVPAHWLGFIGVDDVAATAAQMAQAGATVLGPAGRPHEPARVVRGAQGAVFALTAPAGPARADAVAWCELNSSDDESAWAAYEAALGWHCTEVVELGAELGRYRMFAAGHSPSENVADNSDEHRPAVGAINNLARKPGVHNHWLYYFPVADIDAAAAAVPGLGGNLLQGPLEIPTGHRAAWCEDPQGAAFALRAPGR